MSAGRQDQPHLITPLRSSTAPGVITPFITVLSGAEKLGAKGTLLNWACNT